MPWGSTGCLWGGCDAVCCQLLLSEIVLEYVWQEGEVQYAELEGAVQDHVVQRGEAQCDVVHGGVRVAVERSLALVQGSVAWAPPLSCQQPLLVPLKEKYNCCKLQPHDEDIRYTSKISFMIAPKTIHTISIIIHQC